MEETVKIEFALSMKGKECKEKVEALLRNMGDVKAFEVDVEKQQVVVESAGSIAAVAAELEKTGMSVRVRGLSGAEEENLGAAVCLMQGDLPSKVKGVVRMIQLSQQAMLFEAAFSGFPPCAAPPCQRYPLQVHASGDITEGARSTGPMYDPRPSEEREYGEKCPGMVGYLVPDGKGVASLCVQSKSLQVASLIGRAMVVGGACERVEGACSGADGEAVGIVARAAGLFENPKKICLCSGKSIWEEDVVA